MRDTRNRKISKREKKLIKFSQCFDGVRWWLVSPILCFWWTFSRLCVSSNIYTLLGFNFTYVSHVLLFADVGCGGNLYVSTKSWQGGGNVTEMPALLNLNTNTLSPPIPTHVISSMGSASSSSSSSSSSGRSRRSTGGRRPNKENGVGYRMVIS